MGLRHFWAPVTMNRIQAGRPVQVGVLLLLAVTGLFLLPALVSYSRTAAATEFRDTCEPVPQAMAGGIPSRHTASLSNGLHAVLCNDIKLPLVTLRLGLPVGRLQDPQGHEGMAELLARTLTDVRAGQVEALGGASGSYVTNDYTVFWVRGLAADYERLVELLVRTVADPRVGKADLARARDRLRGELKLDQSRPGPVARRRLMVELYGEDHPRGRNAGWRSLGRTGRREAEQRLARYYGALGAQLAVVGAIDVDRFAMAVEAAAGEWPRGELLPRVPVPSVTLTKPRVVRMSMKGLTQSSIVFGWPGIRRTDTDWERFQVFNHVLGGGGFASRLMQAVRVEEGRAYGVRSVAEAGLTAGPITVSTATASAGTDEAVALILEELKRLLEGGITRQELTEAQEHLKGSYRLSQATPDGLAGMMISARMLGLGDAFARHHYEKLEAVDAPAALEVGRRLLDGGNYVLVIVENPKK